MKRFISIVIISVIIITCLSACTNSDSNTFKAYNFKVDTGDSIRVELNTSDGYDITSDLPFVVSFEGKTQSQGIFIEANQYEQYAKVVDSDSKAKLIDSGTKDDIKYVFWSYDNSEYNIVVLVGDSNTGILLGNAVSEESAKNCFERLTFTVNE